MHHCGVSSMNTYVSCVCVFEFAYANWLLGTRRDASNCCRAIIMMIIDGSEVSMRCLLQGKKEGEGEEQREAKKGSQYQGQLQIE